MPKSDSDGNRLVSLDAYRGFVMLAMVSSGLGMGHLLSDPTWGRLADQFSHRAWEGCTFWDLIQPSFLFIVGVAMAFSFAARGGQPWGRQLFHVVKRCALLIAIGIVLDSYAENRIVIQFIRVLQQIAIGYFLAFLVIHLGPLVQFAAALLLLAGHTAAYLIYAKTTGPDAWLPTDNFGRYLDAALSLPLSRGYYVTFNAISSTATILFGVVAGQLLRGGLASLNKVAILLLAGILGLAGGWALSGGGEPFAVSFTPLVPLVKRLWTASFAIYAAGWTCLMLALFYLLIDVMQIRGWSVVLVVVGMNSIFIYVLHAFVGPNIGRALGIFLGEPLSDVPLLAPVLLALFVLLVEWLICLWLYLNRVFVKL